MNIKILEYYLMKKDVLKHLKEETTSFAQPKDNDYLGWGFVSHDPKTYAHHAAVYKKDGTVELISSSESNIGLRLATDYSELMNDCKNKKQIDDGVFEFEYGEYPQTKATSEEQEKINSYLLSNNLSKTGKTYTYCNKKEYKVESLSEMVDNDGNKYVYKNNSWFKVEPLKWIASEKSGIAISKYIISGGVSFYDVNPVRYYYEYMIKSANNALGLLTAISKEIKPSIVTLHKKAEQKETSNKVKTL